jgi:hypothetical protein
VREAVSLRSLSLRPITIYVLGEPLWVSMNDKYYRYYALEKLLSTNIHQPAIL